MKFLEETTGRHLTLGGLLESIWVGEEMSQGSFCFGYVPGGLEVASWLLAGRSVSPRGSLNALVRVTHQKRVDQKIPRRQVFNPRSLARLK